MDVFGALGLDDGGTNASILTKKYGIETGEARVLTKKLLNRTDGTISAGFPNRGLIFVNATAVRRIAQRSNTPAAREFQTFLNKTVAGAIEKDGAYIHPAVAQEAPDILKMVEQVAAKLRHRDNTNISPRHRRGIACTSRMMYNTQILVQTFTTR